MPLYNVEIEIQDRFDVEVSMIGNSVTSGGGTDPVVNSEETLLPDQGTYPGKHTVRDVVITNGPYTNKVIDKNDSDAVLMTITDIVKSFSSGVDYTMGDENKVIIQDFDGFFAGTRLNAEAFIKLGSSLKFFLFIPSVQIKNTLDETILQFGGLGSDPDWDVLFFESNANEITLGIQPPIPALQNKALLDSAGTPIGVIVQGRDATAPDARAIDSAGTFEDILSGDVELLSDIDVSNSDNATVLYTEPRFSVVSLPSIRLTVGATDHDYETSEFSYAAGILTKTIDDIAVSSGAIVTKCANFYQTNAHARTSAIHPWYVNRGDTKSICIRFKYNIDPVTSTNLVLYANRRADGSVPGVRITYYAPGLISVIVFSSVSNWTNVSFLIPTEQYVTKNTWNSVSISFNGTRANEISVYLNGRTLAISSIASDTLTAGSCIPTTKSSFNAEYNLDDTTFATGLGPRNSRFGGAMFVNKAISAAEALEFHERRRTAVSSFSYSADIAHRYISRDADISTTDLTDEVTGLHPFIITNGTDATNNYDSP